MKKWVQLYQCDRCAKLVTRDVTGYMENERNVEENSDETERANVYLNTGAGIYHECKMRVAVEGKTIYGFARNIGLEREEVSATDENLAKGGM